MPMHIMGRGYNNNSILYPLSMALEGIKLIFCCFICVTKQWALHVVIMIVPQWWQGEHSAVLPQSTVTISNQSYSTPQ